MVNQSPRKPFLDKARQGFAATLSTVNGRVAPGFRSILGLVLIVGGTFGFLPILGFWMIPLGVAVVLLDIKLLVGWSRNFFRSGRNGKNR